MAAGMAATGGDDAVGTRDALTCRRLDTSAPTTAAAVRGFYRANGYKASCRPADVVVALLDGGENLVAVVRLQSRGSTRAPLVFLRSLCVGVPWRRKGVGTRLTQAALAAYMSRDGEEVAQLEGDSPSTAAAATPVTATTTAYCFCEPPLVALYASAGFVAAHPRDVPPALADHYGRVAAQQARGGARTDLRLMLQPITCGRMDAAGAAARGAAARGADADSCSPPPHQRPLRIALLQHARERGRPTATAPLLSDGRLLHHVTIVAALQWGGRADNANVDAALARLTAPVLLWVEGGAPPAPTDADAEAADEADDAPTYVILDGTWQEARAIFRKGPASLRALARVRLEAAAPSAYVLRGDYGWRERVGAAGGPTHLLCTAECGALLLERAGDATGGARVRAVLAQFQAEYAESHPHVHARRAGGARRRKHKESSDTIV